MDQDQVNLTLAGMLKHVDVGGGLRRTTVLRAEDWLSTCVGTAMYFGPRRTPTPF